MNVNHGCCSLVILAIIYVPLTVLDDTDLLFLSPSLFSFSSIEIRRKCVTVHNSHGEKLVGVLHETNSLELVIICHGFKSSKVCHNNLNT